MRNLSWCEGSIGCLLSQVGVGNSRLQLDMAQEGYTSITSIDYAEVVIEQMQQSHQQYPQLHYDVADARSAEDFPQTFWSHCTTMT